MNPYFEIRKAPSCPSSYTVHERVHSEYTDGVRIHYRQKASSDAGSLLERSIVSDWSLLYPHCSCAVEIRVLVPFIIIYLLKCHVKNDLLSLCHEGCYFFPALSKTLASNFLFFWAALFWCNQPNLLVQKQYPRWCPFEGGTALESGVWTLLAELRAFWHLGSYVHRLTFACPFWSTSYGKHPFRIKLKGIHSHVCS